MNKIFLLKPRINKKNGQINLSLPRKKIPKQLADHIFDTNQIKMELLGWD